MIGTQGETTSARIYSGNSLTAVNVTRGSVLSQRSAGCLGSPGIGPLPPSYPAPVSSIRADLNLRVLLCAPEAGELDAGACAQVKLEVDRLSIQARDSRASGTSRPGHGCAVWARAWLHAADCAVITCCRWTSLQQIPTRLGASLLKPTPLRSGTICSQWRQGWTVRGAECWAVTSRLEPPGVPASRRCHSPSTPCDPTPHKVCT